MTTRELYEQIGGNYDDAIARLQMDRLIDRFVVKFLEDDSIPKLIGAWEAGDEAAAFEAAHSAKGVCANLALASLAEPASAITEALRPGNDALRDATDVDVLVAGLAETYHSVTEAITAYAAAQ